MTNYVIKTNKGYFYLQGYKNPKICFTDNYQLAYCYDTHKEAENVVKSLESQIEDNMIIVKL